MREVIKGSAIREITGRQATSARVDGITAETLNRHYAGVSTDPAYVKPAQKQIDGDPCPPQSISEWDMFRMLNLLRPTSAGLDGLPAWFLKIAAPIFCYHLSYLFNLSLSTSTCLVSGKKPVFDLSLKYRHPDSQLTSDLSQSHQY